MKIKWFVLFLNISILTVFGLSVWQNFFNKSKINHSIVLKTIQENINNEFFLIDNEQIELKKYYLFI